MQRKITLDSCYFSGAHDDPINVHGTNLRAIEKVNDHTLNLRFMHGQSYGFQAYYEGDTVAFVKASTMERLSTARVESIHKLSEYIWQVRFDREIPQWLELGHDCVETLLGLRKLKSQTIISHELLPEVLSFLPLVK